MKIFNIKWKCKSWHISEYFCDFKILFMLQNNYKNVINTGSSDIIFLQAMRFMPLACASRASHI